MSASRRTISKADPWIANDRIVGLPNSQMRYNQQLSQPKIDELRVGPHLPHHHNRIAFGPVVIESDAQLVFAALDQAHCKAGVAVETAVVIALHVDRIAVDILEQHHHGVGPPEAISITSCIKQIKR